MKSSQSVTHLVLPLVAGLFLVAKTAEAQQSSMYYAQCGALLAYSDAQIRLLYAAVGAKEFDAALTKGVIKELERSLEVAKRSSDRAASLLTDKEAKFEPKLLKIRDAIKQAEGQLKAFATDVEEQTGSLGNSEGDEEDGPLVNDTDDEATPNKTDWSLLKTGVGWLGVDLKAARTLHRKLAGKLALRSMKYPPSPRGKRD